MTPRDVPLVFNRQGVVEALWADPISHVTSQDVPARLHKGDEYLDLQHLEAGVQRAHGAMAPTGGELSRSAVHPATWARLMASLRSPDEDQHT